MPEGRERQASGGLVLKRGAWRIAALALVLAAALTCLAGLGEMPLSDRAEGRYAAGAAAMVRSGHYLVPTLNGRPYLERPILPFWSVAACFQALGKDELAARLPSALAAFLLVVLTGLLVWRTAGSLAPAVLAAGALAFSPLLVLLGRACLPEAMFTLFTSFSLGAFFMAQETAPPRDRVWYLAAWAGLGLGFLSQGSLAPALVLPPALIYSLCQNRLGQTLKRMQLPWGLSIFLLINLPWYGLAFYELGAGFWQVLLPGRELGPFTRLLPGYGGKAAYYLSLVFMGAFPFSAAAAPALARALARNPLRARRADPMARLRLLAALSLLGTLLVFFLAPGKQLGCILSALPFAAILAGYFLWRLGAGEALGRAARASFWGLLALGSAVWFLALAGLPLGIKLLWPALENSPWSAAGVYALPAQAPLMIFWPLLGALLAAALWAWPWWLRRRQRQGWLGLGLLGVGLAFCACLGLGLLPAAAGLVQEPAREMALALRARTGDRVPVVSYGLDKPSLLYYLDRDIPALETRDKLRLARMLSTREPLLVLTSLRLGEKLRSMSAFTAIAPFSGYLLGGNRAARALWKDTDTGESDK